MSNNPLRLGTGDTREQTPLPPEQDDDIPSEVREELMRCATGNGRISYWYLCHLWRRGRRVGRESVIGFCAECGPVTAWDEDGCCKSCGDDVPQAHGLVPPAQAQGES